MNEITTIGVDLAKNQFSNLHGVDRGRITRSCRGSLQLRRTKMLEFFQKAAKDGCLIGMLRLVPVRALLGARLTPNSGMTCASAHAAQSRYVTGGLCETWQNRPSRRRSVLN